MIRISELFLSIQGEGPSAGTPAHFIRLQGCDVGCRWCDTRYSWDAALGRELRMDEALDEARSLGRSQLLVVTGGEPLQHPALGELLDHALERWRRVEVETSGVGMPPRSHDRLFYNVSPKLPSATDRWEASWRHIGAWNAEPRATFKIVVGEPPDLAQALDLISRHALPAGRVMLMPEGRDREALARHARPLAEACRTHGFRLSPRLHIWIWGARRGV
ncbi:MAG: 7-carboxy-7-deazaguanine synthase QueE [Candidatus Eiseniibacteriota bacterium]